MSESDVLLRGSFSCGPLWVSLQHLVKRQVSISHTVRCQFLSVQKTCAPRIHETNRPLVIRRRTQARNLQIYRSAIREDSSGMIIRGDLAYDLSTRQGAGWRCA